jgi:hypothetical protein
MYLVRKIGRKETNIYANDMITSEYVIHEELFSLVFNQFCCRFHHSNPSSSGERNGGLKKAWIGVWFQNKLSGRVVEGSYRDIRVCSDILVEVLNKITEKYQPE